MDWTGLDVCSVEDFFVQSDYISISAMDKSRCEKRNGYS